MTKLERFGLVSLAEGWRIRASKLAGRAFEPGVDPEDSRAMQERADALQEAAKELLESLEAV